MDEESSIISTAECGLLCPTGTDKLLARVAAAELWLVGHGQSAIHIRSGEFMVRVINQSASHLSMAVCMVGDHLWPIAMDTPVLKVGARKFSFALPGFFLGLELPDSCIESDLERIEAILTRFCAYEDFSSGEEDFSLCSSAVDFWLSVRPRIEKCSIRLPEKKTASQPKVTVHVRNSNGSSDSEQRAIRTSAVVKLVSQAFLRGALNLNLHVQILKPAGTAEDSRTFASIRAFTDVVDAVETAGHSIASDVCPRAMGVDSKCWIFSKSGLTLLLRAVAATAVVHVARNSIARAEVGPEGELSSESCLTGSNSTGKTVEA